MALGSVPGRRHCAHAKSTSNAPFQLLEKAEVLLHPGPRASGGGLEPEEALLALAGPLMDGSAGTFH